MERAKDMIPSAHPLPINSPVARGGLIAISIIVFFHLIGLIGLYIPSLRVQFLAFIPYHLLLMTAVIMFSAQSAGTKLPLFALCVILLGFGAEWLGVNTHLLFGNYQYGQTLGIQLSGVPLIIGLNWFLLIYSSGVLIQRSRIKNSFVRIIAGAAILVVLDVLIEPVAPRFDYWHWANNTIPVKNYICWFLFSAAMLFLFEQFHFRKQNIVAPVLLITQFLFFAALHWSSYTYR